MSYEITTSQMNGSTERLRFIARSAEPINKAAKAQIEEKIDEIENLLDKIDPSGVLRESARSVAIHIVAETGRSADDVLAYVHAGVLTEAARILLQDPNYASDTVFAR